MILPAEGDFRLADEAATARLGAAVARTLAAGEAVCLSGPLGAGKSTLARGLIRALTGAGRGRAQPTFTLVQFYDGARLKLAHFDLYRLSKPERGGRDRPGRGAGRRRGGDRMAGAARPASAAAIDSI